MHWFGKVRYLVLLITVSSAFAGSYDDFFAAIMRDDGPAVQKLIQRGFDPNTVDPQGRHPLMLAIAAPSPTAAAVIAAAEKTDVNVLNASDESPLMMAVLKGQETLAAQLIEKGADVNKTGWTPLHYAATSGHAGLIRLLLENHAFVDPQSPNGTTPLMMAAQYGSTAAVRLLLEEGAQPLQKNSLGLTAFDFARRANRPDALVLLNAAVRAQQPAGKW
jgi:ankyrin repeat protein